MLKIEIKKIYSGEQLMLRKVLITGTSIAAAVTVALTASTAFAGGYNKGFETKFKTPMMSAVKGWKTKPLFTVGETLDNNYTPVGVMDGIGAYKKDYKTIRAFVNHELLFFRGAPLTLCGSKDCSSTYELATGARVSFFDIDRFSKKIVKSGLAIKRVYNANGVLATKREDFLPDFQKGFSRFCSAQFEDRNAFGHGRGMKNSMFMTGEEDGGNFNNVGGAEWALDPKTGNLWHVPAFGRGAWENVVQIDTGSRSHVAFILADDSSPFDADGDGENEAAPLYLYVGKKDRHGDFLARNGLRGGKLYVWVAKDSSVNSPAEFNGKGNKLKGKFVEIDNSPTGTPSEDGSTGFDKFGYPTQKTLWTRAEQLGAFQFSRPEDVARNPRKGNEFVLASTGVDTFDVDPNTGNGVDTFGTMYTMKVKFNNLYAPKGTLKIIYDGDEDKTRALRSPDNLDWADDGYIYVQEDEAEEDTLSGDEVLFGPDAVNKNEASIVRLKKNGKKLPERIASIDRSVILDPTVANPKSAVDTDAGKAGEWESSGILDVSKLFGKKGGTLFLYSVQAHGIEDQEKVNPTSRINDNDLVEGGQLLLLEKESKKGYRHWKWKH